MMRGRSVVVVVVVVVVQVVVVLVSISFRSREKLYVVVVVNELSFSPLPILKHLDGKVLDGFRLSFVIWFVD